MTISNVNSVTSTLAYFSPPPDGSKAYTVANVDPVTGQRAKNWETVPHQIEVENIRGKEHPVSLDTTSFQIAKQGVPHTTFENDEVVQAEYYPQSIDIVKEITGASKAVVFDHTIRRRRPREIHDSPNKRQPVLQVHIDQTEASAIARVHPSR